MGDFSHPGSEHKTPVDVNQLIGNTLIVSRNTWKYAAEIATELDPDLPPVACFPNEIGQAVLNLLINAVQAIGDAAGSRPSAKGRITLRTRRSGDYAEIEVQDTGTGIPESIRSRVFDPFFTTRDVGKGPGQGLWVAQTIVVEKHGGTIGFTSEMGQGTTFVVRLPIGGRCAAATAASVPEDALDSDTGRTAPAATR